MADPVRDKDVRNKANAAGPAKDLGKGWKVKSFIIVKPGRQLLSRRLMAGGYPADMDDSHWQLAILDTPYVLGRRERAFG